MSERGQVAAVGVEAGLGCPVHVGDADGDGRAGDELLEGRQVALQILQGGGIGVVDQQDQADPAFRQDVPHEAEALLARGAVEHDLLAAGQVEDAVVHGDGGGAA
jgi:hypothetical protein